MYVPWYQPAPRPLFATGELLATSCDWWCDGLDVWKCEEEPLSAPPRNQTSTAAADSLVLARALPCLVARFSVHLLWTWLGSCSIQDPAPVYASTYCCCVPRTIAAIVLCAAPRYLHTCTRWPTRSLSVLLLGQAKVLQTSITQDYIRPSTANMPPDRSPHTALE